MVTLFATAPGNPALRDDTGRSFFIKELCEQLQIRQRRTLHQEINTYKLYWTTKLDTIQFLRIHSTTFYSNWDN